MRIDFFDLNKVHFFLIIHKATPHSHSSMDYSWSSLRSFGVVELDLLREQTRKDGHCCIILHDRLLTSLSTRSVLFEFLSDNWLFESLGLISLSLFLRIFFHLVEHSWHLTWTLVDINSVILLSLLIGKYLHIIGSSIGSITFLIFDHHTLILLCQHLSCGDIDCNLPLSLLFLFDFSLCLECLQSLFILFLCNSLHFLQFILFLLKSFFSCFSIGNDLWECVHVFKRSIFSLQGFQARRCLRCDFLSLLSFCLIFSVLDICSIINLFLVAVFFRIFFFLLTFTLRFRGLLIFLFLLLLWMFFLMWLLLIMMRMAISMRV